jgi:hypothetical protein
MVKEVLEDIGDTMMQIVIKCPVCSYRQSKVIDKRNPEGMIRRRRMCLMCKTRYTTYEFLVIKMKPKEKIDKITALEKKIEELKEELSIEVQRGIIAEEERKKEEGENYFKL